MQLMTCMFFGKVNRIITHFICCIYLPGMYWYLKIFLTYLPSISSCNDVVKKWKLLPCLQRWNLIMTHVQVAKLYHKLLKLRVIQNYLCLYAVRIIPSCCNVSRFKDHYRIAMLINGLKVPFAIFF